ncbi:hypothetical protein BRADI_4g20552v3 [Brachypodium distachyon]|uniref:Uncharacterized protein n=1 Tax=Brachypodium distachyon TaxID=15368 RepID=A0A0Q3H5F5_BRADI|nr:hypothetical protein BRADI_4g20552v3 [Brachypodium distachyon]
MGNCIPCSPCIPSCWQCCCPCLSCCCPSSGDAACPISPNFYCGCCPAINLNPCPGSVNVSCCDRNGRDATKGRLR